MHTKLRNVKIRHGYMTSIDHLKFHKSNHPNLLLLIMLPGSNSGICRYTGAKKLFFNNFTRHEHANIHKTQAHVV